MNPGRALQHESIRPRTRRRRSTVALFAGVLLAASLVAAAAPEIPDEPDRPKRLLSNVILCDATGCYVAWAVVDSDHDGVSDADEIMAGTDPYDAASFPRLEHLVNLGAVHELPSFEAGLAAFVVLPVEIVKMRAEAGMNTQGAFAAVKDRAGALDRMGISGGQLAEFGINPEQDGFTIGLDSVGSKDSLPGRRVAGIDARLISYGHDAVDSTVAHGGVSKSGTNMFGEDVIVYKDGAYDVTSVKGDTRMIESYGADGSKGNTSITTSKDTMQGDVKVRTETTSTSNADGGRVSKETTEVHSFPGGGLSKLSVKTEYKLDAEGNIIGTKVTTKVDMINADGSYGSSSQTVQSCDANGKNCTDANPPSYGDSDSEEEDAEEDDAENDHEGDEDDAEEDDADKDHGGEEGDGEVEEGDVVHVNPDADTVIVTHEMVDGVLRTRGAAINVIAGWSAPDFKNEPKDPRNPSTVALIDSDLHTHYLLVEPMRTTKAQPEFRPDLPSPREGAPLPNNGGCDGLC